MINPNSTGRSKEMEILLHTCCGPCATYSTEHLVREGYRPTMYYYNPNIHPFREWRQRREAVQTFAQIKELPLIIEEEYDLEDYLRQVVFHEKERCGYCYRLRLAKTAKKAKASGMEWFGTTLLISPYQNREQIIAIGRELAAEAGLCFYEEDFRPGFHRSQEIAKELGLYRQGYCGCIYSEFERYAKKRNRPKPRE